MAPSPRGGSPFDDDETLPYTLDSTYWDPNTGGGTVERDYQANDNIFGLSDSAGNDAYAAGSQAAAAGHGAVPSARDDESEASAPVAKNKPSHVVLSFDETARPIAEVSGRIGSKGPAASGSRQATGQGSASRPADGPAVDPLPSDVAGAFSIFNIKRYRRYFNVDTHEVLTRMLDSVIGFWKADFFEKTIDNADLYGPFWIATTLIFVSAVAGNCASYLSYAAHHSAKATAASDLVWYYDINKVSYSAILYYGYIGVVGSAAWGVLKFFSAAVALPQVWCIYGYALSIYIPTSVVCIVPMASVRWGLTAGATAISALFILANLRSPIFENVGAKALPMYLVLAAAHAALGLGMVLYFFQY